MPNSATTLMNANLNISVEDQNHQYVLTAVVYYGHHHFTNQIITHDGRVWFYDGMAMLDQQVLPNLEYVGSTIRRQQDLYNCRGNNSCAAIYAHQWKVVLGYMHTKKKKPERDSYMPHVVVAHTSKSLSQLWLFSGWNLWLHPSSHRSSPSQLGFRPFKYYRYATNHTQLGCSRRG